MEEIFLAIYFYLLVPTKLSLRMFFVIPSLISRHLLRIHFANKGKIPWILGGNRGMEKRIENARLKRLESH
jgi:hypothetical protein